MIRGWAWCHYGQELAAGLAIKPSITLLPMFGQLRPSGRCYLIPQPQIGKITFLKDFIEGRFAPLPRSNGLQPRQIFNCKIW